jgi:hypothetical protein
MHLPQLHQRGLVLPVIYLKSNAVCFVHDSSDGSVNEESVLEANLDAVPTLYRIWGLGTVSNHVLAR